MPGLNVDDKRKLLRTMLYSRHGDLREQSLIRQGKGWFHVSGMGHEALAVAGYLLRDGDFFAGYYRDRPIALARGLSTYDLALAFFAKRTSASGGRQMPAHYSHRGRGILSIASVVGASLLPAAGLAWSLQLDGRENCVLTTVGDAGTRQGEFYEAVAFAIERQLPLVFLVEDNGIGISTVTDAMTPLGLGMLPPEHWQQVDGCDPEAVFKAVHPAFVAARSGGGPQFLWCRTERISSHSSADDHRKYRSEEELAGLDRKDPLTRLKEDLIGRGELTEEGYAEMEESLREEVRDAYLRALGEVDPQPEDLLRHVLGPASNPPGLSLEGIGEEARMVDTINATFHAAIRRSGDVVFFGQDIEDPKGGVFSLTKGLSSAAPAQVFNSPLAEATIVGVAAGMAAYGKRPVFEIQFTDFLWPGFNQLVTQLSTLHWRSNAEWSAPAVIYAPYGAYLPGGALWHSQTNESALAHFPGLEIAIPSTPEDAAGLFWTALHGNSPTLVLIPKHLLWAARRLEWPLQPVPFGKAAVRRRGDRLTIVCYGNGTEVVEKALAEVQPGENEVEVLDLRTIVPLDFSAVEESVARTGRLLVVQEDGESCSVGQGIISRIAGNPELFGSLKAPPMLISKPDVNIGYHPQLEYAALPEPRRVAARIRELLAADSGRRKVATKIPGETDGRALRKMRQSFSGNEKSTPPERSLPVRVPILGEGITSARVTALLVEPGEDIAPDDPLCEVETDKALFPIESPQAGRFGEWKIAVDDEVEVEQVIAEMIVREENGDGPRAAVSSAPAGKASSEAMQAPQIAADGSVPEGGLPPRVIAQLKDVVPAHMTVKAGWQAIREARANAKRADPANAPSPTVMVAYAVVQAMRKHPVFCCTIHPEGTLRHRKVFDFGVAVALERDALDTAVIPRASELEGPGFFAAYREAVAAVRRGEARSKAQVPVILTSMGGFAVRDAQPLVVPPAMATLFLGSAHQEPLGDNRFREEVALCLSFDHRWLNGAAGAHFLHDVKAEMEAFAAALT
ncbi:MAG: hypothetical protein GVY10_12245 [Verrucomicrobia bacterium]|jgi:2-oxoisovalerate dehydrogenase E1 component|nr:hypothetical protein [Verrucomicrobiota bacterium]